MRGMLTLVALLLAGSAAHAAGYKAMQNFDCTYVSRAFEDERNHRKTLSPVPDPQALTTLPTREIAHFVGGYLTAWSAVGSIYDKRPDAYNVYPPGLFPALNKIDGFCASNPTKSILDALNDLMTSPDANPIQAMQ